MRFTPFSSILQSRNANYPSAARRAAIKIRTLLTILTIPLGVLVLFFIATTGIAYLNQGVEEYRIFGVNLRRLLELLDLREENTLATWFSSTLILTTGLAFTLLGWGQSETFKISHFSRFIMQLAAIGAVLLSADEVGSVHETVGKLIQRVFSADSAAHNQGFWWLFVFVPIFLIGLLAIIRPLLNMIGHMPGAVIYRRGAYIAFISALIFLPSVFIIEGVEAYLISNHFAPTLLRVFEEAAEVLGMYSLFFCVMLIGRQYQL